MPFWHALNRGVEKRDIFLDNRDRARFVHDLFEFNDSSPSGSVSHSFRYMGLRSTKKRTGRKPIVEVHGWCLMRSHYHLLLSELAPGGLTLFLRKLNVGYANYFNERYERTGTLFQSRTKKIPILRDAHLNYILHYIHFNPLDHLEGAEEWRGRDKGGIADAEDAFGHLSGYRWSSFRDYIGEKNFPSLLTTSFFRDTIGDYGEEAKRYLRAAEMDFKGREKLWLESGRDDE